MDHVMGKGARRIVLVAGPTASGKSALALRLARAFDGVVINADSMQVYRGLPILTAQPDEIARAAAPHRLYGVLDAGEACSVARWRDMALAEIERAGAAGRLAVLVGGTGLYLRALLQGLAELPEIPAGIRDEARRFVAEAGPAAAHAWLAGKDPETAAGLAPGDRQRLARAIEVLRATSRGLRAWQRDARPAPELHAGTILLMPPRAVLRERCDARFRNMVEAGALREVAAIMARGLDPSLPAMKVLGLRELASHLAGDCGLDEAVVRAQAATRRYAKRQTTWFRHQFKADLVVKDSESLEGDIFAFIRHFLLTTPV
ncbi:MAG: tRNA (adenosine(37)-N6)-dimethylallyltransferase MiaA [Alphaproteobacteria bacterium]|nr:tRNA (adenosine(37)-N6)-dimethylallyltransferase MiaA [Alphaproteobacteria bacterium]